jgi:hypothetical protein
MGYYGMLGVVFAILILSVIVQGEALFSDAFFAIAYAVMAIVLVIGTKSRPGSKPAIAIGLLLIFSVGFLSTNVLIDFFSKPVTPNVFFKLAIAASLDTSALFFLNYGRQMRKEERIPETIEL